MANAKNKTVSITIPFALYEQVKEVAQKERRSLSAQIVVFLEQALEQRESQS